MPIRSIQVALLSSLLLSCSPLGDSSVNIEDIPNTTSVNFQQITVSARGRLEVRSDKVETYSKKDLTVFSGADVREYDAEGVLSMEGRAEHIEVDGDSNVRAEGAITIHDLVEDAHLQAEALYWEEQERLLTGDGRVTLESRDGLVMTGQGFSADVARQIYYYADGVEGTVEIDDVD